MKRTLISYLCPEKLKFREKFWNGRKWDIFGEWRIGIRLYISSLATNKICAKINRACNENRISWHTPRPRYFLFSFHSEWEFQSQNLSPRDLDPQSFCPRPQSPLLNFVSPALSPYPRLCPHPCPRPQIFKFPVPVPGRGSRGSQSPMPTSDFTSYRLYNNREI